MANQSKPIRFLGGPAAHKFKSPPTGCSVLFCPENPNFHRRTHTTPANRRQSYCRPVRRSGALKQSSWHLLRQVWRWSSGRRRNTPSKATSRKNSTQVKAKAQQGNLRTSAHSPRLALALQLSLSLSLELSLSLSLELSLS